MQNIVYKSDGIIKWLDGYRDKWEDFYPSERWAFQKFSDERGTLGRILDVGCAMGGLALALAGRFDVKEYVGVDINRAAIDRALGQNQPRFTVPAKFFCEDILKVKDFRDVPFDVVVSLSCADWNIETDKIIWRCWEAVKKGGVFVMSVRLTPGEGVNDITRSHQPIAVGQDGAVIETANYVVFNVQDLLRRFENLSPRPSKVAGYGYWGKPSANAVTPYARLVFGVFVVEKSLKGDKPIESELNFPSDLFTITKK